jgi:hypothetical protein
MALKSKQGGRVFKKINRDRLPVVTYDQSPAAAYSAAITRRPNPPTLISPQTCLNRHHSACQRAFSCTTHLSHCVSWQSKPRVLPRPRQEDEDGVESVDALSLDETIVKLRATASSGDVPFFKMKQNGISKLGGKKSL